jgi:4-alpha-glucanotransferase
MAPPISPLYKRSSGLLLHISSLPGAYGIGDLGHEAYAFADFLQSSGQTIWQVLPIVPVGYGYSPYSSPSTFAGNTLFVSPSLLMEDGLLTLDETIYPSSAAGQDTVDFEGASAFKNDLLKRAWERFLDGDFVSVRNAFQEFKERNTSWLDDYALYEAIKETQGAKGWTDWTPALRDREPDAMDLFLEQNGEMVERIMFNQFLFDKQWSALKGYCHERNIQLFGDLPIYVAQDSADVWANRELFYLDESGKPTVVSGVPPDYFAVTGQRWGNPLYRWDVMKARKYAWWTGRMGRILELVDIVRLDHFRGFEAYWEIPASEETAVKGVWKKGPGADLFRALEDELGTLPVVAENLGVITEEVTDLMREFGFPGMAILQFAFDSDPDNPFLPHNYEEDIVAYTGTHDNDTLLGWWNDSSSTQNADEIARARSYCTEYLEGHRGPDEIQGLHGGDPGSRCPVSGLRGENEYARNDHE